MSDDSMNEVVSLVVIVVLLVVWISCTILAHDSGFEKGYTEALQDMKKNKPPKYILVEQKDGTTIWEENKVTK